MSELGFIKLHRKLIDSWLWKETSKVLALYLYLILVANYKDKKWFNILKGEEVMIRRGALVTSVKSLSLATRLSTQSVKTALKRLKNRQKINLQSNLDGNNRYTLITILNYSKYQGDVKCLTSTLDSNLTTTKEVKNINNTTSSIIMSGKPNFSTGKVKFKTEQEMTDCKKVVDHLNKMTGKEYRYSLASMVPIRSRYRDGYSYVDMAKVISLLSREEFFTKDDFYHMSPKTIFRPSNFENYMQRKIKFEKRVHGTKQCDGNKNS